MCNRWIGIDCGYSQMTLAILDGMSDVVAVEYTREPLGDGHDHDVALARLRLLLHRLSDHRHIPVWLAGYCYERSGVLEEFQDAGWTVEGDKALNDVVGIHGLTDMVGHAIVCGCGSFSQLVYIDGVNNVRWPGDDIVGDLPKGLLSGWHYASFLLDLSKQASDGLEWLPQQVSDLLGSQDLDKSGHRWGQLGPLLSRLWGHPVMDDFISEATDAMTRTRDLIWQYVDTPEPPMVVVGGGAVRDNDIWAALSQDISKRGVAICRAQGVPAVGLARFAARHQDVEAWAYLGRIRPSWLE